jgi:dephospho-CoA kinase
MLKIAITGGIGSGKSTVVDLFKKHQIPVIDTDVIARQLTEPGQEGLGRIIRTLGKDFILENGSLDRKKLRNHVFDNEDARQQLQAILHPLIRQRVDEEIHQLMTNNSPAYCLIVIPLLAESKQSSLPADVKDYEYDRVLVVDTSLDKQFERTAQRDKTTKANIEKIIKVQAGREARLKLADDIIENNGSLNELEEKVKQLHKKYLSLA